jgi:hypothetical protein
MSFTKQSAALGLALLAWAAWAQQSCGSKTSGANNNNRPATNQQSTPVMNQSTPANTPTPATGGNVSGEMRTLAEGAYGPVEEPFVAVVRDAETYAELRALAGQLPELKEDFFASNAVVAAFLGTRRTGGYAVEITRQGGALRVSEKRPPKDAMLTQALTQPFKIVSVGAGAENPPRLELNGEWGARHKYSVTTGSFEQSGGIAGRREQFQVRGDIRTAQLGRLVTLHLFLASASSANPRSLRTVATGLAGGSGNFRLPRLDAGTLVDRPNGGLAANGQLSENNTKLSLTFEPLPDNVADGFEGRGSLEARSDGGPK